MAASWVAVCNSALTKLGANLITSISEDTPEARAVRERYEECRDLVLRSHPWNCAIKRVVLSPLVSTPEWGFSSKYQMPSDCIRVIAIENDPEYRINGREILCDESEVNLLYVYRVEDPTQLDPLLADAIAFYLAYDVCYRLTQSADLRNALYGQYREAIRLAKNIDSREEPAGSLHANFYLQSRYAEQSLPNVTRP